MNLLIPIIASCITLTTAGQVYNTPIHVNTRPSGPYQSALEFQRGQYNQPRGFAPTPIAQNHVPRHQQQGPTNVQHRGPPPVGQHRQGYQGSPEKNARILSYDSQNNHHNYQYSYETENGIKAQESGQIEKGTQAQGAYSYKGDDGHVYTVTYTADEYGFRPQGDHLPTPPPIPEEIAKGLEQNAQEAANGVYDDGSYKPQQTEDYQQYQSTSGYQQNGYQQGNYQQQNGYQQSSHQQQNSYQLGNQQQNSYQLGNQQQNSYQLGNQQQNTYQQGSYLQQNGYQQGGHLQNGYQQGSYQQNNLRQNNYQNSQYHNHNVIPTTGNSGYHN